MQDAQAFFDLAALKAGGSLIRVAKAVVPFAGILKILGQVRQRAAALFSQKSPVNIQIVASARLFRRIWFREENAVSEAEKNAENAIRTISATKSVILPSSIIKVAQLYFLIIIC